MSNVLKHYIEFDKLNEVALFIHYDYEPAEAQVLYPIDDAYEGCAENANISDVLMMVDDNLVSILNIVSDELRAELVEHCLEDYRGGE